MQCSEARNFCSAHNKSKFITKGKAVEKIVSLKSSILWAIFVRLSSFVLSSTPFIFHVPLIDRMAVIDGLIMMFQLSLRLVKKKKKLGSRCCQPVLFYLRLQAKHKKNGRKIHQAQTLFGPMTCWNIFSLSATGLKTFYVNFVAG